MDEKKLRGKDKSQRPKRMLISPQKHTPQQEQDIFYILYELCDRKYTRMAELLFITPQTARRWDEQGFPNPHWAFVCRWIISDLLKYERTKAGSKHREKQKKLYARYYSLPNFNDQLDNLDSITPTDMSEAATYVRTLLYSKKLFSMPWHKIKLPANSGGYSMKVLRRALNDIGAVSETTGFGEDKTTIWRLPIDPSMLS